MDSTDDEPVEKPRLQELMQETELGEGLNFSREDEPKGVPLRFYPQPFDEQPVGPNGETLAAMRVAMFERLERMRGEVERACANDLLSDSQAAKLQLSIYREQCALVGLPVAYQAQAF